MEDDEILFEIKDAIKKSRNSFESVINKKDMSNEELDQMMNCF